MKSIAKTYSLKKRTQYKRYKVGVTLQGIIGQAVLEELGNYSIHIQIKSVYIH